ncbi:MAG: tRNA (adenosine(37)-N6)-dimethylallyltransferase MiaA [Candidatus Omnitrophica bacterium 4484_213]|nr:MAG: tRNA (adenosine(37)-N6)-dimethylallyltransferase MiaA [Candidatus Omnitrophica bacterium 4484_213]
MQNRNNKAVVFLLGPTGVGKSEVSILLAKEIGAEIISADSMQVYRGMDIGTDKLQVASYRLQVKNQKDKKIQPVVINGINHYLIDIVEPNEEFNVAKFMELAEEAIRQIYKKGKIPLVVGGSALYIYSLIKGIFKTPPDLRANPELKIESDDRNALYKKLVEIDPQAAAKIHPRNLRRVRRALEVYYQTGIPFSQLNQQREGIEKRCKIIKIGLISPRPELYQQVEGRVEKMFKQGLVEEVKRIKGKMGKTATQALGYREIISYLDGKYSLDEAKDLIKKNTRHFVKHQLTWFRRDKEINWIDVKGKDKNEIAEEVRGKIDRLIKL